MNNYKDIVYALVCLSFSIVVGAAVFEHLSVWPRAYVAIPKSLTMFQGEYGLNAANFWIKIHPITLLLFVVNLILFWKSDRRKNLLIVFISYFIILIITNLYFVPELIELTGTEMSNTVDESLVKRGGLWINLSLIRTLAIVVLAIVLSLGLTKPGTRKK
ncbi:MAG: hypothetical protein DWP94_00750 [Flavobacterium sp.]|nr:MAG: hypothetical protein DWP94_00750 [Flavobacterium sp.]